jgi:hypothetical protein
VSFPDQSFALSTIRFLYLRFTSQHRIESDNLTEPYLHEWSDDVSGVERRGCSGGLSGGRDKPSWRDSKGRLERASASFTLEFITIWVILCLSRKEAQPM